MTRSNTNIVLLFILAPLFFQGCLETTTYNPLNADLDGDGVTAFDGDCDDNDDTVLDISDDADCGNDINGVLFPGQRPALRKALGVPGCELI